ncbi:MAG: PQQ-dependent sugar dehydrogenase [Bauldia sp.]
MLFRPKFGSIIRSERAAFRVELLAERLAHPWGLDFLPDGRMIVTERAGRMRIVTARGEISHAIAGVPPVVAKGQGGLLDVALHPRFAENRLVYWTFSEPGPGGSSTALARGRLSEDGGRFADVAILFSQKPKVGGTYHFGSRIVFDGAGRLFVGLGERFNDRTRMQAQELGSHLGKVIRLNEDGTVPADNPYVGQAGALPELWSIGHRNIQAMAIEPATGALWEVEHGPMGGDELNLVRPRANYGWPVVSFGVNYDGTPVGSGKSAAPGFEPPVWQWTPVIAPSGMAFYDAAAFPAWRGNLFVGGLATTCVVRLEMEDGRVVHEERMLRDLGLRIREVAVGPDGALHLLTDEDNGHLLRLSPA